MLTAEEKSFFAHIALAAGELSGCEKREGAVLIRGRQILSYGFRKKLIRDKEWEISAIYDALFGARTEDLTQSILFCTHFPSLEDLKLIVSVGITVLYFFGNIENSETIRLANSLSEEKIPLEIIQLKK